jgi:hypothetical protein
VEGEVDPRSGEARIDLMPEFTLEIETVNGVADSDYLDRLAETVYDLDELVAPMLSLNANGSVGASFSILAGSAPEAAQRGVALFAEALTRARPLRVLVAEGDQGEAAIGSLSVEPTAEPQTVRA